MNRHIDISETVSYIDALRIRRQLIRTEAALEGDWMGEAKNPRHDGRLRNVTSTITGLSTLMSGYESLDNDLAHIWA